MAKKATRHVYSFGGGKAQGSAKMKNLLGGKGANLAEMSGLGVPVPPGFTITTEVCTHFMKTNGKYPAGLTKQVDLAVKKVEKLMKKGFGDPDNTLLVSVRSGALGGPDRVPDLLHRIRPVIDEREHPPVIIGEWKLVFGLAVVMGL
ncbi:PEP/pyruvate-binding domain-containing protein, partial [Planctomycetota bacterium]